MSRSEECDDAVKRMLGHMLDVKARSMGRHYMVDYSAEQSAKDACCAFIDFSHECKDQIKLVAQVEQALRKVPVMEIAAADLRDIYLKPLRRASPALQAALIPTRPLFESMHWRIAFRFPKYFGGPDWWD